MLMGTSVPPGSLPAVSLYVPEEVHFLGGAEGAQLAGERLLPCVGSDVDL